MFVGFLSPDSRFAVLNGFRYVVSMVGPVHERISEVREDFIGSLLIGDRREVRTAPVCRRIVARQAVACIPTGQR
jgi:hypothetical protein